MSLPQRRKKHAQICSKFAADHRPHGPRTCPERGPSGRRGGRTGRTEENGWGRPAQGRRGVSGRLEGSEGKGDASNTDTGPRNGRVLPTPSRLSSSFAVKKDEADPGVDVATFSAASDPEPGGPRALGP